MSFEGTLNSTQKALEINLNGSIYGTFAEIGAGQEVARHFFRAGGAAGTIAKSMSAYDMTVSDAIYGKSTRYVSLERLETMLKRELTQLQERLEKARGKETSFFVFADTVAAKSFKTKVDGHGWLGLRFQNSPLSEPSQAIIHVSMKDKANLQQQEALGTCGVNLVYACYHFTEDREKFVKTLMDNLSSERIEIDMIEVEGPAFRGVDSRLWALELVKHGYCNSIMFDPEGEILLAADYLYKKNIVVCRGSYRPPTHVNIDMLEKGTDAFKENLSKGEEKNVLVLPEISMHKLRERGEVDNEDFLARVDLLGTLGYHCMISSYQSYGDLSRYIASCTKLKIGMIFGFYNLEEIFNESKYDDEPGGLLSALGDLLCHQTTLYCYPGYEEKGHKVLTTAEAGVKKAVKPLIDYLEGRKLLFNIEDYDESHFTIWSRVVLRMISEGDAKWETMVPVQVARQVKKQALFGLPKETTIKKTSKKKTAAKKK